MSIDRQPERQVEDIIEKLDSEVALDVADVKFILSYKDWQSDDAPLDEYKEAIDEAISAALGHDVYRSILEEFKREGVIEELREDLIDPALEADVQSYHKGGTDRTLVYTHPPEKMPDRLNRIRHSIFQYLYCTGKGFSFDPEMIYAVEDDYRAFLELVITCSRELDSSQLRVDVDGETITIKIVSEKLTYYWVFDQPGDYLKTDALNPIVHALAKEGSETLLYSTEYLLVVEQEHKDLVKQYTSPWSDGEEEYRDKIRKRIDNYLHFGKTDPLKRVIQDLKTHAPEAVEAVFAEHEQSWREDLWVDEEDVDELKATLNEEITALDLS